MARDIGYGLYDTAELAAGPSVASAPYVARKPDGYRLPGRIVRATALGRQR